MAVSLGDAMNISEIRLPRQSVVALISESVDCAKNVSAYRRTPCFKQ